MISLLMSESVFLGFESFATGLVRTGSFESGTRFRHSINSGERISPCPDDSYLNTSIIGELSPRLIRQTPSLVIIVLSPNACKPASNPS